MSTLTVEGLSFEVKTSARRRSVEIVIERDGALLLHAPEGCAPEVMERFIRGRLLWLHTKLAAKEQLNATVPPRVYVSGEGFPWLGRSYRLLIVDDSAQEVPLQLEQDRFKLRRSDLAQGRDHMIAWYTAQALPWLKVRIADLAPRMEAHPLSIHVQDLGFRWGSCGARGRLNFHWRTILLPPDLIDYVIVHELVHFHEPHHTPAFWARLERVIPDWPTRKQQLAERGAELMTI